MTTKQAALPHLSRTGARPAPPIRIVHLGLGNFFRAHQAWYTEQASDGSEWGIAAFTGRRRALATALAAQDGVYTLITRGMTDEFEVISALSRAHPADEHDDWLRYLASPEVRIVTLTVTEAGYTRGRDGGLDRTDPSVVADIAALHTDVRAPVATAVARLVAGLAARRAAAPDAPLTVLPCDNLPDNGEILAQVARELAEETVPGLRPWIDTAVSFATSVVDRITPATTAEDVLAVEQATGRHDSAPVVAEPFREWVLSGDFPGGRPAWEGAGAVHTTDTIPYENRKLWLLNGAHSLLAYTAPLRGHATVGEAVADETCRRWIHDWWNVAVRHLDLPAADLAAYREALLTRFANPRMGHKLAQIATNGSQKLPGRILPVLRAERAAGRMPVGVVRVLAGWLCHLNGTGVQVSDRAARGVTTAAAAIGLLDRALSQDAELLAAIDTQARRLRGN